jgi:hypothetical protein
MYCFTVYTAAAHPGSATTTTKFYEVELELLRVKVCMVWVGKRGSAEHFFLQRMMRSLWVGEALPSKQLHVWRVKAKESLHNSGAVNHGTKKVLKSVAFFSRLRLDGVFGSKVLMESCLRIH